jgi:cell division protein ZapA
MPMAATDTPVYLDVLIFGREYRIACREDERPALLEAVALLDRRMGEIRDAGKVTGVERIAVMAALNLANDLLRERKEGARSPGGAIDAPALARRIRDMHAAIDRTLASADEPL